MTILEELQGKLKQLSVNELLALQNQLTTELSQKIGTPADKPTNSPVTQGEPLLLNLIPGAYRPTEIEIEEELQALFTPEEMSEMDKLDLTNLPPLPKSLGEYVSEDREDRV